MQEHVHHDRRLQSRIAGEGHCITPVPWPCQTAHPITSMDGGVQTDLIKPPIAGGSAGSVSPVTIQKMT